MSATDPQSLLAQGKCYACFGADVDVFKMMKLALLAQIATSMATDPQSLLAAAKCFMCFGVTQSEAMELALLSSIASGGVSTGSNWFSGNYGGGVPTPTPTGTAGAIDTSNKEFWIFFGGAWHDTGIQTT